MLPSPLPLRAHAVLCLQGYRGEGYSEAFTARMTEVHAALNQDPDLEVRVLTSPGFLCGACPHYGQGCTLGGPGHETHMRRHDEVVLDRLGLAAGAVLPWKRIVGLVSRALQGRDLASICGSCPWLPHGWCTAAIDSLHVDTPSEGPSPT